LKAKATSTIPEMPKGGAPATTPVVSTTCRLEPLNVAGTDEIRLVRRPGLGVAWVLILGVRRVYVCSLGRKRAECRICENEIAIGARSWRETGTSSNQRMWRVCTRCWPYKVDHDQGGSGGGHPPAG
jgi:hypothetical protein